MGYLMRGKLVGNICYNDRSTRPLSQTQEFQFKLAKKVRVIY